MSGLTGEWLLRSRRSSCSDDNALILLVSSTMTACSWATDSGLMRQRLMNTSGFAVNPSSNRDTHCMGFGDVVSEETDSIGQLANQLACHLLIGSCAHLRDSR